MLAELARRYRALPPLQRMRWAAIAPLGLAVALLEGLAGAVVFALLSRLLDPAAADGWFGAVAVYLPAPSGADPLVGLALWAAAIHILKNLLLAATSWWRARMAAFDTAALSTRLLRGYVAAPWPFHLQRTSAALLERLHDGTRPYLDALEAGSVIATEAAVIVVLAGVAIAAAPVTISLMVAVVALLLAALLGATRRAQARGGAASIALGASLYRDVHDALGAAKELAILGRGAFFVDRYARDARAHAALSARRAILEAAPRLLFESAFVLGIVGLIASAGSSEVLQARLPLVSLYVYVGFRVVPAAHRIAFQSGILRWSLSASEPVIEDLARFGKPTPRPATPAPLAFEHVWRAAGVSYTYEGMPRPALDGVDLTIHKGELVAIAGATGAGKTTLVDVMIGLLPASRGEVTVDGQPIGSASGAWQRNIGYVPQSPYLLDDSIRRNVAVGIADAEIDEAALGRALRLAQLEDLVRALPSGDQAHVGELGVRLSGGERQRIAIARALYHDPAVLVLDEAMSALDPGTERQISDAIEPLRGTRTVVVISHRVSTLERCDRVVVVDAGRIVADGSCAHLAEHSPAFRAVAAL